MRKSSDLTKLSGAVGNNDDRGEKADYPDHIGWDLWRANDRWKSSFVRGMQDRGHDWFTEARSNILGHLPRTGLRQADLAARTGHSKQAIQQFVDGLVEEGILCRELDPQDARARIVRLTEAGHEAMRDADTVKAAVEAEFAERFDPEEFVQFRRLLKRLAEDAE